MQRLEASGAVRPIYGSLGVKRLIISLIVDKKFNGLEYCFIVLNIIPEDRVGNLLETVHKCFMLL